MPLTSKGAEIKSAMENQYGKEKGEQVFYASKNAGKITGVDRGDAEDSIAERKQGGEEETIEASQDLPSQLGSAEDELERLEREQEQVEEGQERSNAIEDTKAQIRSLRKDIKDQAAEALKGSSSRADETPLEKAEREDAEAQLVKRTVEICDAIEGRLDAFEKKRDFAPALAR
jgi:hypothetical protein